MSLQHRRKPNRNNGIPFKNCTAYACLSVTCISCTHHPDTGRGPVEAASDKTTRRARRLAAHHQPQLEADALEFEILTLAQDIQLWSQTYFKCTTSPVVRLHFTRYTNYEATQNLTSRIRRLTPWKPKMTYQCKTFTQFWYADHFRP
jgi:hypothetical protein